MSESAVEFATQTRIHIAIAVTDVTRSRPFYETLFGCAPTKVRPGYIKFEVAEPPVNFTLNQSQRGQGHVGPQHFGIQVKHSDAVAEAQQRMSRAGHQTITENQTNCCHAIQDKVWAVDPDGHRWEVFVVTQADAKPTEPVPKEIEEILQGKADEPCCAPTCCAS